jgi:hypothetical protein
MDNLEKNSNAVSGPNQEVLRPYTKPSFEFERVFETNALSCGPGTRCVNGNFGYTS